MFSLKFRLRGVPIGTVLTTLAMQSSFPLGVIALGIAGEIVPQLTQLAQSNVPPPRRNPGSSVSGGRRDPIACPQDASMPRTDSGLIALSPATKLGTTLAERPSFLVYVPETSASTAEFSLRDYNGRGIYRTTLALSNRSGIVSLSLPTQVPPLEVGEQYTWSFAIICDPNHRLNDRFVTGMVQRIEFDPARLRQIQQTSLRDQVSSYQEADVWYDTLTALFELHHTQPNDSSIHAIWDELLQSGGVSVMLN